MLDNFDNLQASWVTQGGKVGQLSLAYGANDMGSVMIEENVVRAAGASYCMDEVEIVRNIEDAGFVAQAPQHALRDPRRSDLPRARRAAHAGAGHGPGGRRHVGAGGAHELRPAAAPANSCGRVFRARQATLIRYHASWVLPISAPPIRDGWVAVDRGRIVAVGHRAPADGARDVDLGDVAVLPGLVNAHTHLELSYLRDEVPPAPAFVTWVRGVMAARRRHADPRAPEILTASITRIAESHAAGTAVVGDISNTLVTFEPLTRGARWRRSCSTS